MGRARGIRLPEDINEQFSDIHQDNWVFKNLKEINIRGLEEI